MIGLKGELLRGGSLLHNNYELWLLFIINSV